MQWHVGGNFEPVLVICAQDWLKCPYALAYYIWFEAVADVADCLANESILWRILAISLICTTIIHLIYWKIRWTREIHISKENVEKVDFRIQDLELKVNILTYKLQYGTWPLPHIEEKKSKDKNQDLEIALSKCNEDNSWIKHFLTSVRRKNLKRGELICDVPSQSSISDSNLDVDMKYLSPKFGDSLLGESGSIGHQLSRISIKKRNVPFSMDRSLAEYQLVKDRVLKNDRSFMDLSKRLTNTDDPNLTKTSSDKVIPGHHTENSTLQSQQYVRSSMGIQKDHLEDDADCFDEELEILSSPTNTTLISSSSPKHEEEASSPCTNDYENNKSTQETLHQVKKRLKSLHLALQNYSSQDRANFSDDIHLNSSHFEEGMMSQYESNVDSYETWKDNPQNKYISDDSTVSQDNRDAALNMSQIITTYSTFNTMIVNEQRPLEFVEYIANDEYSTLENMADSGQDEVIEVKELEKSKFLTLAEELQTYKLDVNRNSTEMSATGDRLILVQDSSNNPKHRNDERISLQKIGSITNKGSDMDDKSTVFILHKALDVKNGLSRQILSRSIDSEIITEEMMGKGDCSHYSNWNNMESIYLPKTLDMITEESSGTSSSNAQSRTNITKLAHSKSDTHLDNKMLKERKTITVVKHESTQTIENIRTEEESKDLKSQRQTNSNLLQKLTLQELSEMNTDNSVDDVKLKNKKDDTENLKTRTNVDLILNLKESSSDTSVNRLIDRLIESERKCKSARSSSDAKTETEFAMDSLNSFIDSHALFTSARSENEYSDSSSAEIDEDGSSNVERREIEVDESGLNRKDYLISESYDSKEVLRPSPQLLEEENKLDENKFGKLESNEDEMEICDEKNADSAVIIDVSEDDNPALEMETQISEPQLEKIHYSEETECHEGGENNLFGDCNVREEEDSTHGSERWSRYKPVNSNEEVADNNDQSTSVHNQPDQSALLDSKIGSECENDEKKDAGDFSSAYKLPMQEFASDNGINLQSPEIETIVEKNSLPSGDTVLSSQRILKDNQYHASCKAPSGMHFSLVLKNQEQAGKKIPKLTSSSSIPKQSMKNNSDSINGKQLKTRSNSNLISADRTSPVPVHRRSKSYAVYRDLSPSVKNNTVEKKSSSESLMLSNASSLRSCTGRESSNENKNNSMSKRENSSESLALSCRSLQSSQMADTPREVLLNQEDIEFRMERSSSFKSLSISSESSQSHNVSSSNKSCNENQNENKILEQRQSAESLLSKVSGRSSIPVLKSRLENDKKSSPEAQSTEQLQKSPLGALKDVSFREKSQVDSEKKNQISPKPNDEREIVLLSPGDANGIHNSSDTKQNAVIYVTTRIMDPREFLQYIKDKELKILNVKNQSPDENLALETKKTLASPRVFHSLSDISDCTDMSSFNSSLLQLQDNSSNSLFLKVDSRETEVLVKPLTVDTSTSICDLSNRTKTVKNKTTEFKIFEVPDELTKEEYISLLQIINENPDLEQLSHMDNLCNKLGLEFSK